MRNKNAVHLRIEGITEEANNYLSAAINFAIEHKRTEVSTVELFMILARDNKVIRGALDYQGISFDMLLEDYAELFEESDINIASKEHIHEYFSTMFDTVCKTLATLKARVGIEAGIEQLIKILLFNLEQNAEMRRFVNNTDIDLYILLNTVDDDLNKGVDIPEPLMMFVKDLNRDTSILEKKISNVDDYVDTCIEILSRKNKACPCIIGNAGVGKSAMVNRLVQRIVTKNVPLEMQDVHICEINGGTLSAGTRYRGDFEQRLKMLFDWATSNKNIVLFFDEIHTFMNSGKSSEETSETGGQLIKPYLSNGSIRLIGTTTTDEYHKFIEKDKAFKRRLQVVNVKEPTAEEAIEMINNTIGEYEAYHNVRIKSDVIEMAVRLSQIYIKSEYLPDKAYTILDQASVKTKLSHKKTVTKNTVLEIISKNSGVDVRDLTSGAIDNIMTLDKRIKQNIIGQDDAVQKVVKAIKRSKAGVHDENRPVASFMFVGPTGVGKTELCKVLSKELGLGRESFIKIDMSEYSEKYSISKLIGAAPGYVGYSDGGQLTEKIKHNPSSIMLFDEIEKAHPSVYNIFLQMLDEGRITDGNGETVDCTNCIIVFTSNAGYGNEVKNTKHLGFVEYTEEENTKEDNARKALEDTFRPEFLNRLDSIVIFNSISKEEASSIAKINLRKLSDRIRGNKEIELDFDNTVVDRVAEKGFNEKFGARNINREIQSTVEDALSDFILSGKMKKRHHYKLKMDKNGKLILQEVVDTKLNKEEVYG